MEQITVEKLKIGSYFKIKKGMMALPSILLIGGVIIEIAIAGVFIIHFVGQSVLGVKISSEALAVSRAGVQDAILKIIREKNFSTGATPYVLTIGNNTADITVCKDTKTDVSLCDTANSGKYEITSLGKAQNKRRKLRSYVNVNAITGEVRVESIIEMAL